MKTVTSDYKNQIKLLGKEIDNVIRYYNHYQIITENNKYILTEDGKKILTEQLKPGSYQDITAEDIYSSKVITHGDLLKTMMKELDFEIKQDIKIGSIVDFKFGLKVNGQYEYVDYGEFIVNKKEFNEDTKTYSYVAYDKMLFTMVPYVAEDISERQGIYTLYDLVEYCCEYCGLQLGVESFPNSEREITNDILKSLDESNFTFRDVLDYATEVTGCSSYMIDDSFVIMPPQKALTDNLFDINKANNYVPINSANTLYEIYENGYLSAMPTRMDYYSTIPHMSATPTTAQINSVLNNGIKVKPNTKYTFLFKNINVCYCDVLIFSYNSEAKFIGINSGLSSQETYIRTFTTNATTNYLMFRFDNESYNSGAKQLNVQDIMLLEGEYTLNTIPNYDFTLYADSFKDNNVKFNKVFGPINSILFSRSEDTDVIEMKDDDSIQANGVTQIKIKDNPFLEGNDRADYFEEMFDVLNGLSYSLNDVSSTGITYLEFNDKYKVSIDENEYDCLLLNDEINVVQGLDETIFTEEPQEKQQEYITSRLDDRGQKWANIQVKKDLGEINLEVGQLSEELDGKVGNNEIITKINLSPEQASIQSNKISLTGKTINLTSDTINIASNNFSVDTNGDMTCNNATMTNAHIVNGSIDITQESGSTVLPIYLTQILDGITYNSRYGSSGIRFIRNGVDMAGLYGNPGSSTNTGGVLLLRNLSGTTTVYARGDENNSGGYFSLSNSSGTQRIYARGDSGWITCVGLTQTSLEKEKKNFERLENALEIVKDVDIYKYNMKDENDTDKKHIGFVIGDKYNYREEITSLNNDGVDTYSMISVLWQAVKEQQKEIEELKERIGK